MEQNVVIIRACRYSVRGDPQNTAKKYIYHPDNLDTFQDMQEDLCHDFGYESKTAAVILHYPGSCADTLLLQHMQLNGALHQNSIFEENPIVDVCFQWKLSARKRPIDSVEPNKTTKGFVLDSPFFGSSTSGTLGSTGEERMQYIRVGRRPVEDFDGEIPTQAMVIARIDTVKRKVAFLSIFTWLINGLRIGDPENGDVIREDEAFSFSSGMTPDPYWCARSFVSATSIRKSLLGILERGTFESLVVCEETVDDAKVAEQRDEAFAGRRYLDMKPVQPFRNTVEGSTAENVLSRFPVPWALPVSPTYASLPFPCGLPAFNTDRVKWDRDLIDVVAVFVNDMYESNLGLTPCVSVTFEPDESLEQIRDHFLSGDEGSAGLKEHKILKEYHWQLELWVLPNVRGCSTLYSWDQVPDKVVRDFCHPDALNELTSRAMLYVEVRIVQDPDHLEEEGEEDLSLEDCRKERSKISST